MLEWFQDMGALGQAFLLIAAPSTIILFIQTIMLFFSGTAGDAGLDSDISGLDGGGADAAGGTGMELDTDLDFGGSHTVHTDGHDMSVHHGDDPQSFDDSGLRLFSIRGVIAFLTVGGWVGVLTVGAGWPAPLCVLTSAVFGFVALYGIAKLMQAMMRLQESGNYEYRHGLGKQGSVYLTIPVGGTGKISLMLGGALGEFAARSADGRAIKTGASVRVVDLVGDVFIVEADE